jgi:hypothetical protein
MQRVINIIRQNIADKIRYSEDDHPDIVKNLPLVPNSNWYDVNTFLPLPAMQIIIDQLIRPIRTASRGKQ